MWCSRRRRDADLDDEIDAHLRMAAHAREAGGLATGTAKAAARREFGSVALVKETARELRGGLWLPLAQRPIFSPPELVLRTSVDPGALVAPLQRVVSDAGTDLRLAGVTTLPDLVITAARRERLVAWLSGTFACLALLLAAIGLYGMVAYAAEQRMAEMGIRLALGALPAQVSGLLMKDVVVLTGIGLIVGGGAALAFARVLRSLLFGLTPTDPGTIVFAAAAFGLTAACAGYLPARRAGRIEPARALRSE
jgi:predicted lysophospholipase L1 biosynthesis ABC-type transport system permease subunit